MKKFFCSLPGICFLGFALLMLCFPQTCKSGAADGLLLCGRVIIPSLFPFTVCVLFLMRSIPNGFYRFLEPLSQKVFRLSGAQFTVFLLSLIGGFPVGARLIAELFEEKKIDRKSAHLLQCCCINAGPGFIVLAVGNGMFGSRAVGNILLASHLISAFVTAGFLRFFLCTSHSAKIQISRPDPLGDRFVGAVADAARSLFGICGYVIFFSTVSAYCTRFSAKLPFLSAISGLLEITTGISHTENLYFASFLIGFSGISILFQVISVSGKVGVRLPYLLISRVTGGTLNLLFTAVLVKIFKPTLLTFGNGIRIISRRHYSSAALSVALLMMGLLLLISLFGKKRGGNPIKDMV